MASGPDVSGRASGDAGIRTSGRRRELTARRERREGSRGRVCAPSTSGPKHSPEVPDHVHVVLVGEPDKHDVLAVARHAEFGAAVWEGTDLLGAPTRTNAVERPGPCGSRTTDTMAPSSSWPTSSGSEPAKLASLLNRP